VLGLSNKPVGTRHTNRPPQDFHSRRLPAGLSLLNANRGKKVLINLQICLIQPVNRASA
jgi:hypothetical protein